MVEFTVSAYVLKQKGDKLYLFPMSSKLLRKICYVTPRSEEDPEEVQRILSEKRAKEIGEYIKKETSLLPNAIVVSLSEEVEILPTGDQKTMTLKFPDEEGKYAYILDGQHRLAGFKHSEGVEFDLPVVAIYNASMETRGKIFADINSKQERVSDVHILELYYQIKELPKDEVATMDVIKSLSEEGPFAGKIKIRDDQKGFWVKNTHLKVLIAPYCESGGILSSKTSSEQAKIFKEYIKGASKVWTEAWGNKDYLLTRPFGMEILFGIFQPVKHRIDLNEGKTYTSDAFYRQMKILRDITIKIPGGEVNFNWKKGRGLKMFTHREGRSTIIKQMRDILHKADEKE